MVNWPLTTITWSSVWSMGTRIRWVANISGVTSPFDYLFFRLGPHYGSQRVWFGSALYRVGSVYAYCTHFRGHLIPLGQGDGRVNWTSLATASRSRCRRRWWLHHWAADTARHRRLVFCVLAWCVFLMSLITRVLVPYQPHRTFIIRFYSR